MKIHVFLVLLMFSVLSSRGFSQDVVLEQETAVESSYAIAPQIIIYSPVQNQRLSGFDVMVNGEVTDDGEVVSLSVGSHSLGVSGSKIPFQKLVLLKDGKNEVRVSAVDNDGNKVERVLTVFREGFENDAISKGTKIVQVIKEQVKPAPKAVKSKEKVITLPTLRIKGIIVKRADFIQISTSRWHSKIVKQGTASDGKITLAKYSTESKPEISPKTIITNNEIKKESNGEIAIPRVFLNKKPMQTAVKPVIKSGRTYVALESSLVSGLGVHVVRDKREGKQHVYFYVKGKAVKVTLKAQSITVNGKSVELGGQVVIKKGHLMVPFRAVCEGLGFKVHWDKQTHTAYLSSVSMTT